MTELQLEKDLLRLKYFKYWSLKDSSFLPDEEFTKKIRHKKEEKFNKELYDDNDMNFEINLIKIYYTIREKIDYNERKYPSFEACEIDAKNDCINLIRLNILYGIAKNWEDKKYFIEANILSKKLDNINLKLLTLFYLAEYHLNHLEFDEFNKYITYCEKNIEEKQLNNSFSNSLKEMITQLTEEKNEKYKIINKNKLYFYTSEPFFYKEESNDDDDDNNLIPLKTEANNSFYLKYNLKLKIPKEMEIIFKFMKKDFLDFLEIEFQNPSKFIYIGSDYFNREGDLFNSDNDELRANYFSSKIFENKIKKFKNKADMVILGFINSQTIARYFTKKNFPNVVYLKKLDILDNLIKKFPYFYFYFQRCFFNFVINFLVNLGKKEIKEAFKDSEEEFENRLSKFGNIYGGKIKEQIIILNNHKIIVYEYKTGEEKKKLFDELNITVSNSLSNNKNNIINEINIENTYNNSDISQNEKKNGNKIDYDDFNLYFDDNLNDCIFDYIINKRYYGNKKILYEVITNILDHKIVNIYGETQTGKTTLCLELCKYFYMNNYFKGGIYYINNINNKKWDKKGEFKDLKNKISNEKDDIFENVLIIFDDKNNLNSCLNFSINYSLYIVIVSTEPIKTCDNKKPDKKNQSGKHNKKRKSSTNETQDSKNNIFFININQNLGINFREEFFNYMKINLFMNNKKLSKNTKKNFDLIKDKDEVYINDIVKLINNNL